MYVKRNYGFWMTFNWSKKPFLLGLLYAGFICSIAYYGGFDISVPWQPLSLIGILVAFYLGFKNNSSYDRSWEARKIWGGIVNNSRSFGAAVVAFVQGDDAHLIHKELIYRHIAWITALRHQLRLSREWEHTEQRIKGLYAPTASEDYHTQLDQDLAEFIPERDIKAYRPMANTATQILADQSRRLQKLKDQEYFEDFRHMEFHSLIRTFYDDQGKSERIKNFPFPRQYASVGLWLTLIFCLLLPFGMINIFINLKGWMFWLCPVFCALVIWSYFLMEMIGDYSENPFEGSYNDVPITSIARGIEIDLREMIGDDNIPDPVSPQNGFLL